MLRLIVNKRMLPTTVNVFEGDSHENDSKRLFSIKRRFSLIRHKVKILDRQGNKIGYFKSKLISIGPSFMVFDTADNQVAQIKGD